MLSSSEKVREFWNGNLLSLRWKKGEPLGVKGGDCNVNEVAFNERVITKYFLVKFPRVFRNFADKTHDSFNYQT